MPLGLLLHGLVVSLLPRIRLHIASQLWGKQVSLAATFRAVRIVHDNKFPRQEGLVGDK